MEDKPKSTNIPLFFQFPGELRTHIYIFYFEDSRVSGAEPQRQTKHATALLFVNRQIHREAVDVMYKTASFSASLGHDYAPLPRRDVIFFYENETMTIENWCSIQSETLQRFRNVRLVIDTPSNDSKSENFTYAFPMLNAYLTQLRVGQHVRITVNIGRLNQGSVFASPVMRLWRQTYVDISFSKSRKCHEGNACTDECTIECKRYNFEERTSAALTLANTSASDIEAFCIVMVVITLGQNARSSGAELYVENSNGEREDITADNAVDLIEQAEGLDEGKGSWVVLDGCWGGWFV